MARFGKSAKKKKVRKVHSHDWYNGDGCEPHFAKCVNCGLVRQAGEQFNDKRLQITPCVCGSITALYEPQLL